MFKIHEVKGCPVVKRSQGVMSMTPDLIGNIAGAVRDRIEWIALLNGKRSEDGYEVTVDRFTIPQQYRTGGDAEMLEQELDSDVVGVIHSHHSMGAFFSGIDTNTLNPRFPSSIVVAIARNSMGFNYKAVGKVTLPCGAVGEVEFKLAVVGAERFAQQVIRGSHEGEAADLGDCEDYETREVDQYTIIETGSCGQTAQGEKPLMFGQDGAQFMSVVQSQTLQRAKSQFGGQYGGYGRSNWWDRDDWQYSTKGDGKGDNTFTPKSNGNGRRGKARGGRKLSARKEGTFRVTDTEDEKQTSTHTDFEVGGGTFVAGSKGCDECRERVMLRYSQVFDEWLCRECWADATRIVEDCAKEEAKDSGVIAPRWKVC